MWESQLRQAVKHMKAMESIEVMNSGEENIDDDEEPQTSMINNS